MPRVASIGFKNAGKAYYFDPGDLSLSNGQNVIVETGRGIEFGTVKGAVLDLNEKEIGQPLKKIIRVATEEDAEKNKDNLSKRDEAMTICNEKIKDRELDMKLIDAEYTFDGAKVIFYFTSDNRVDFRELVKDLATAFHRRIELRQVGVRDEAKLLGGIGSCGRSLCCAQWLRDFEPVSIKMAKVQNLSLNPTKISGSCGRLMCCLKYENDIYQEMRKGMPTQGEMIETAEGKARVTDSNILRGQIKARLIEEEKTSEEPEKLSTDIYTYTKNEIKRIGKQGSGKPKANRRNQKEVNDEIREAIADEIIDNLV